MKPRNIDLNLLTVFDAIMVEGNMSRAAEDIGMTQPAISQAVSRLRALVGDPLFERSGRGVTPTSRALAMAAPVRHALETLVNAVEGGEVFDCRESERTFKLALNDYGELLYLPRLMTWLRDSGATIGIKTFPTMQSDQVKDLRYGTLDLLFWLQPIEEKEVSVHQLSTERQACLVRADHPAVKKGSFTLKDYVSLDHLTIRLPGDNTQSVVAQRIRAYGQERRVALEVHTCLQMPPILASTDLVSTLPVRMAEAMAKNYPLKVLKAPLPEMSLPIYMMWHRSMDEDVGHKWLRERFIEIAAQKGFAD